MDSEELASQQIPFMFVAPNLASKQLMGGAQAAPLPVSLSDVAAAVDSLSVPSAVLTSTLSPFSVFIDWDKDGWGTGTGTGGGWGSGGWGSGSWGSSGGSSGFGDDDVTSLVRPGRAAVTAEYGRDQSTALAPTVSGRGSILLDNRDRRFSPRNTSSSLYGKIKPARPVMVTRTVGVPLTLPFTIPGVIDDPVTYTLFVGHTDDNPINPDVNDKSVTISLVDSLADFRGLNIATPLYSGIRTGQAIGYILDAAGWPEDLRDLDPGATVIPWWWEDNADALTAMEKVLQAEGPPALLTVGVDGEIVFKDRHHRLLSTASTTSQQIWGDVSAGVGLFPHGSLVPSSTLYPAGAAFVPDVIMNLPFSYDEAWRNIINTGTVEIGVRQGRDPEDVWTSDATLTLSAGEQRTITASTSDPFLNAEDPVEGIDYTVVSGTPTVVLGQVNGSSATIQITADGGSPAIIEGLKLRAQPVSVSYNVQVSASDSESVADFGPRSFPNDLSWCNQYDAEAVLQTAIAQRAQPNPIVQVRFMVGDQAGRVAAILARDLSDRVTIAESETTLNDDFYIESIVHDLSSVFDHAVTFGLEMVPPIFTVPADTSFRFDDTDKGFDEGTFSSGLIQTELLLRFDDATVGFDEGGFAW